VFSTYERPSAEPLNGRCPDAPTCELDTITRSWREDANGLNVAPRHTCTEELAYALPCANDVPERTAHYTLDELALRTGVAHDALRDPKDTGQPGHYAAIDVVRLAVVDRLVRSGVPVARAAALVRAAESRAVAWV